MPEPLRGMAVASSLLALLVMLLMPVSLSSASSAAPPDDAEQAGAPSLLPGGLLPVIVTPEMDLVAALSRLRAGDTALLAPGTHNVGVAKPDLRRGTAAKPITVTALDPNRPPLIAGSLNLRSPDHWILDNLRFRATVAGKEALRMTGGQGWRVANSEIFGASRTKAFANVSIDNLCHDLSRVRCRPTKWEFVDNCVHSAGPGTAPGHSILTDHNMYISAAGTSTGRVSRNLFFGAPNGANIKIGRRSVADKPGPAASGITVRYNTLHGSRRGIIVVGRVHGTDVRYNLIVGGGSAREGAYINASTRRLPRKAKPNLVKDNLFRQVPLYRNRSPIHVGRNALRGSYRLRANKVAARDPAFNGTTCATYQPREATARRYGHFSTFFGSGI